MATSNWEIITKVFPIALSKLYSISSAAMGYSGDFTAPNTTPMSSRGATRGLMSELTNTSLSTQGVQSSWWLIIGI